MRTNVTHGDLKIEIDRSGEIVTLRFEGSCDFKNPGEILGPLFSELLVENYREIRFSFTKFKFMNSATVPPVVQFIKQLETRRISGVVIYDETIKWQAKTFGLLKSFLKSQRVRCIVFRSESPNKNSSP